MNNLKEEKLFKSRISILCIVLLIIMVLVFYSTYAFSIASMQLGWWQTYALRLINGNMLYSDVYCFLPPYFVWCIVPLYQLFGNHMVAYLWLGIVFKIVLLSIVFLILSTKFNPVAALLGTFIGFVVDSSYLMDMPFDYNPIIMFIISLSVLFLVLSFNSKGRKRLFFLTISGFFVGFHFMTKQTGIISIIGTFILIGLLDLRHTTIKEFLFDILFFSIGVIICALPGYIYLFATGTFDDYLSCISISSESKSSFAYSLSLFFKNVFNFWDLLIALSAFSLCLLLFIKEKMMKKDRWNIANKNRTKVICLFFFSFGCLITAIGARFGTDIISFVNVFDADIYSLFLFYLLIVASIIPIFIFFRKNKYYPAFMCCLLTLLVSIGVLLFQGSPYGSISNLYSNVNLFDSKRLFVQISEYFFFAFVTYESFLILLNKKPMLNRSIYILLISFFFFNFTFIFSSSTIEEISMTVVVAFTISYLLNIVCPKKVTYLKNALVYGLASMLVFSTVTYKQIKPYSWWGFALPPIDNPSDHLVASKIPGLEGYYLPTSTESAYSNIYDIIMTNCTSPEDTLYEFPTFSLFTVLTEKTNSNYAPIHYFDVCPDSIAIQDAKNLQENPPKVIIWSDIGESGWYYNELIFRDGNKSGQRAIKEWYESYVFSTYEYALGFNTSFGFINVWVRPW